MIMILVTHSALGAALGAMAGEPALGAALGFASHFVLDAIPHWDYELRSSRKDEQNPLNDDLIIGRDFWFDLLKIGLDAALGLGLAFWLAGGLGLAGAFGALLPDFLPFAYFKFRRFPPLRALQKFHLRVHATRRLTEPILGSGLQLALIIIVVVWFSLWR